MLQTLLPSLSWVLKNGFGVGLLGQQLNPRFQIYRRQDPTLVRTHPLDCHISDFILRLLQTDFRCSSEIRSESGHSDVR
jgi:hypothetical protein